MNSKYVAIFSPRWWEMEHRREQLILEQGSTTGFPDGSTGTGGFKIYDVNKAYKKDDVVLRDKDLFMANADIPAGTIFVIGSIGATWSEVSSNILVLTDFDSARGYVSGTVVNHRNILWRAKVSTAPGPFNQNQWEELSVSQAQRTVVALFQNTIAYKEGQLIVAQNKLYMANKDVFGAWNQDDWNLITTDLTVTIGDYVINGNYKLNEIIFFNGVLYRAKKALSSPGAFNYDDWLAVGGSSGIPDHNPSKVYREGELVARNDFIYRAKVNDVSGAWDQTKWLELAGRSRVRGDFVANLDVVYKRSDIVFYSGQLWQANGDIINPTVFTVGTAGATWKSLSRKGAIAPFYENTFYVKGDMVLYQQKIYESKDSKFIATWDFADWDYRFNLDVTITGYKNNRQYFKDNIITVENRLYRCLTNIDIPKNYDAADWEDISGLFKGIYSTANAYLKDSMVVHSNRLYRANANIAAGTAFSVGTTSTEWTEVSPPANPSAPDWTSGSSYNTFDLAILEGKLYRCKVDHVADVVFDETKWVSLKAEAPAVVPPFLVGEDYVAAQIIVQDGVLYRARQEIVDAAAEDSPSDPAGAALWQAVSLTYLNLPEYSESNSFRKDELTIKEGKLYRLNKDLPSATAFSLADWEPVSVELVTVPDYDLAKIYQKDELSVITGVIRRAVRVTGPGLTEADWEFITPRNSWQGVFDSNVDYKQGDTVIYTGALWHATADVTKGQPFDYLQWVRVNIGYGLKLYSADLFLNSGDPVVYKNKLYVTDVPHTTTATFVTNNFILLGDFTTLIPPFNDAVGYSVGNLVTHENAIWRSIADRDPQAWEVNDWEKIAIVKVKIPAHDPAQAYEAGEPVVHDNKLYLAKVEVAASTAFDPEDGNWLLVSSNAVDTELWAPSVDVAIGEMRIVNGVKMRSKTARTTKATLDEQELREWSLASETSANRASMVWDYPVVIGANTDFDLDGNVNGFSGEKFTVTADLPTKNYVTLKSLGYRFKLNGLDVTADTVQGSTDAFLKLTSFWIDKGDIFEVVAP